MSVRDDVSPRLQMRGLSHPRGILRFVPGFLYLLIIYVVGVVAFHDPRAALFHIGAYELSWVEVLLVAAAMIGMGEQMKVSHPGIDNTMEAIIMLGLAGLQLMLLVLGVAGIGAFAIFNRTEFLLLTAIGLMAAVIALLINARTLQRTIGVGDGS
jgi:hypothetical protein